MTCENPLRLLAQDADDLQIVSAALQDAVVRLSDIAYAPAERTLTVPLTRFRWEADESERVQAAVQFGDVVSVQARNLDGRDKEAMRALLAVEFEPGEAPGGRVHLRFAGEGDMRIEVECVDAVMADLCEPWAAVAKPRHGA